MRKSGRWAEEIAKANGKLGALVFAFRLLGLDIRPEQENVADEEIWRSTEEGKHFKFESTTGEVKAGFGGRFNGKKIGESWRPGKSNTFNPKQAAQKTGSGHTGIIQPISASGFSAKAWSGMEKAAKNAPDFEKWTSGLTKAQKKEIEDQRALCGTQESSEEYSHRIYDMLAGKLDKTPPSVEHTVAHGKNIIESYQRKIFTQATGSQEIDTEIEDVLHEQGFDGVPRVVNKDEFDRIVKEHPEMPLLLRTYAAPNAEILAEYDKQLESGFWYVDCGVGGAQYGQGMYCAGAYNLSTDRFDKLTDQDLDIRGVLFSAQNGRTYELVEKEEPMPDADFLMINTPYLVKDSTGEMRLVRLNDDSFELEDVESGEPIKNGDELISKAQGVWECMESGVASREEAFERAQKEIGHYIKLGMERMLQEKEKNPTVTFEPQASVRVMTLDPSAKIVTYEELQDIKSQTMDRIGNEGRIDFDAHEKIKKYVEEHPEAEMICNNYPIMSDFARENARETESGRKAVEFAESVWNERKERIRVAEMLRHVDDGVFAAMLGYDAINAEGHGESGSYTVVLNRTKVILCDQQGAVDKVG